MGTIRTRVYADGRRLIFVDFVAADGRRVREVIHTPSGENLRRFARKVLQQREAEAILGQHRLRAKETPRFGEYAAEWLQRKTPQIRPKTLELYEDMLTFHLPPYFGQMRVGAITRRVVEEHLSARHQLAEHLRRTAGESKPRRRLSARTINVGLGLLKQIMQDAVDHGVIGANPAARVKPLRDPAAEDGDRLHIFQPDEITRLLDFADEPYRTLYDLIIYGSGLRRGEALALRWRDLDLQARRLQVQRQLSRVRDGGKYVVREEPLKTKHARRAIEDLPESVVQALLALPRSGDPARDWVFRTRVRREERGCMRTVEVPLDPDNLDRAFKRHLTSAGLADRPFHATRHTHASLLIAAGVHPKAIQARLGHSSIKVTMDIYGHLMPSAY